MSRAGKDAEATGPNSTATRQASNTALHAGAERDAGGQTGAHLKKTTKILETSSDITG